MPAITGLIAAQHLLALLLLCAAAPALAAERHALVIGNAAYRGETPLQNTLNDARDMARLLAGLGFEIAGGGALENADRHTMARAISRFLSRVQGRDGIAMIYYSGHGMRDRFDGNYLIPIDAQIEQEPDVRAAGIALSDILDTLDERPRGAVSLVLVDACRNNPFAVGAKGDKRGLGRVDPARGTLVLYSASPGQQADDNPTGRNGLFTKHLLAQITRPGLDVEDAFDAVSLAVERDSGGAQIPWSGGNLRGKVYLAGAGNGHDGGTGDARDYDLIAWEDAKGCGQPACYRAYLKDHPDGRFAAMAAAMVDVATAAARIPVAGQSFRDPLRGGGEGPEMVVIPAGSFLMGADDGDPDEQPVHRVRISRAFALGKYEVTFAEYDHFARATGRGLPEDEGWGRGRRPVINLSWDDASAYAEWLSQQTGADYRLPTEAEWEYAARAGTTTAYWWGDRASHEHANYGADTCCGGLAQGRDRWETTAPVGSFPANPFGLHDTAGNVWEWVLDGYDSEAYASHAETDPVVRQDGSNRVKRGGSWDNTPRALRSANRGSDSPGNSINYLGFRLARTF